jgi:hypothetical protein
VSAVVVVAAIHGWAAWDSTTPVQTKDEIGYLMAGRLLAGAGGAELSAPDFAGGYAVGWGVVTAPLWWLGVTPDQLYQLSIGVNVVLAVAAVPVLVALARRFGAGPRGAALAAVAVSVAPGRALYTGYAQPEALLSLVLAVVALLLWDVLVRGAGWRHLTLVAVLAGFLMWTHARTAPVVATVVVALAWAAWCERRPAAATAAAGTVAVAGVGWWLNGRVEDLLYPDVPGRAAAAADQVSGLSLSTAAAVTAGHAWYGAAAWLGLTLLGCVVLVARLVSFPPGPSETGRRAWSGWLLASVAGSLVVGAAYLSTRFGEGARLDMIVYGRYLDPLWGLLALVGAAAALSGGIRRRTAVATVVTSVIVSIGGWAAVRLLESDATGVLWLNVPGLQQWTWWDGQSSAVPVVRATVLLLVAITAAVAAASRPGAARPVAVGLLAVLLATGTVRAEVGSFRPQDDLLRERFALREAVVDREPGSVVLVLDRPLLLSGNAFQFWLVDVPVRTADPGDGPVRTVPGELVVGPTAPRSDRAPAAPRADVEGRLVLVETDPRGQYAVWEVAG